MGKAKNFQAPCKGSPLLAPWAISASVDLILPAKDEKSQSSLRLKYRPRLYALPAASLTAFFYKFSGFETCKKNDRSKKLPSSAGKILST